MEEEQTLKNPSSEVPEPKKEIDMSDAEEYKSKKGDKTYLRKKVMDVKIPEEFKEKFLQLDTKQDPAVLYYIKEKPKTDAEKEEAKKKRETAKKQRATERKLRKEEFLAYKNLLKKEYQESKEAYGKEFKKAMKEGRPPKQSVIEAKNLAENKYRTAVNSKNKEDAQNAVSELLKSS